MEKFTTIADLKEKLVNTLSAHLPELSQGMNLTSDIFMANHKLKAGFYLNITF